MRVPREEDDRDEEEEEEEEEEEATNPWHFLLQDPGRVWGSRPRVTNPRVRDLTRALHMV